MNGEAIEWLGRESKHPPGVCAEHAGVCSLLTRLSSHTEAFEEELFSHLVALREVDRRADLVRRAQSMAILKQLSNIEDRLDKMSNGGLRESFMDAIPVILQNAGLGNVERIKGRWGAAAAAISLLSAILTAVISRWLTT